MIRYSLKCQSGHCFEGWFGSSGDYDSQRAGKLVQCPVCSSHEIAKELMAPAVSTSSGKQLRDTKTGEVARTAVLHPEGLEASKRQMLMQMRELRDKILQGSQDVGNRFSEEARKIHFGEAEARGIHGQASLDEVAELVEEGIDIMPIPDLPEEHN